jgi:hypothetical protein
MKGRSDSGTQDESRYKTLVGVSTAIASPPDLQALLQSTSVFLSMVLPFNSIGLLLPRLRRVRQRRRLLSMLVISSLILAIAIHVPAQQLKIKKNQLLVLNIGTPTGEVEQFNGTLAYRFLIQDHPFIEVQFIQPLPARKVQRGRMTFACEEVGVYTDGSTHQVWTIGKRCKLR